MHPLYVRTVSGIVLSDVKPLQHNVTDERGPLYDYSSSIVYISLYSFIYLFAHFLLLSKKVAQSLCHFNEKYLRFSAALEYSLST